MKIIQSVSELVKYHQEVEQLLTMTEIVSLFKFSEAHVRRAILAPNGVKPLVTFGTMKLYSKAQILKLK